MENQENQNNSVEEQAQVSNQAQPQAQPNTIQINNQMVAAAKNSLGTAGFVLALIALFLSWVPVFGWILWVLGALFSVIGLFKMPRGFAIAGTIISFIGFIILIVALAGIASMGLF